jgi:hypothetical protein
MRISRFASCSRHSISESPEGWHLGRLASHDDPRLVRLISSGEFAARDRFSPSEARRVQIARVAVRS